MPSKQVLLVLCFLWLLQVDGFFWRRRRRRSTPPPPQRCRVSPWTSWSSCSQQCSVGSSTRTRTIVTQASWDGDCPYGLSETKSCGSQKGGCQHTCSVDSNNNKQCSCDPGYRKSGMNCYDINECTPNGGKGPCSHTCRNMVPLFTCQCPTGYYLDSTKVNCTAHDCGNPSSLFDPCPSNSYKDHISSVCADVAMNCSQGTDYNKQCAMTCPQNYTLAIITAQQHKQFGEDYSSVDFSSVQSTITCKKSQVAQSNVWSVTNSELKKYFCRRTNDPPSDLSLNGSLLLEHTQVGSVIGILSSQDAQQGQTFIYTVVQSNTLVTTQGDKLINIWDNPRRNGNVSLNNGALVVTIRSTDSGVPAMWLERSFNVTVVDVNDPPDNIQLSNSVIYENATIGSVVGDLTAVDGDDPPDTKPHSNFVWKLVDSDNGKFVLVANSIKVAQSLAGEAQKLHKIVVNCSDNGIPPPVKSKVAKFVIDILNINDVPGSLHLTNSTVKETAEVDTVVGQLVVTEKDGDDVSFDISQSDAATLDKFKLSKAGCQGSGQAYDCTVDLMVKSPLDYEAKAFYRMNVQANDTQSRTFKQFNIEIVNENEAPTAINLTGSHSVMENAAAGTVIGQLVVTDPDNANFPLYQTHICSFNNSFPGDEQFFVINSGLVLQVKGVHPINYETMKNLSFEVMCKDSGHPSLSLSKVFIISVKDVNEPPRNLVLSNANINENSPKDTPVGKLSSDDPDGSGDIPTYSIVGPADTPFSLGGVNNQTLLVSGPLDHEVNPTLLITIRVMDSGGLFIEKTFKITVDDVNDPPTNISLSTPFMPEESAAKVLISPIILSDQDGDSPSCHLINSAGGRVEVVGTNLVSGPTVTDFESLPPDKQLGIELNCTDQHGKFIEKSLIIKVEDINEAPSQITLSGTTVNENEVGVVVGHVTVSDPDIGQTHHCEVYDLVIDPATSTESLQPSQYFSVDNSFNLTTYKGLNFEEVHSTDIVINCSDVVSGSQRSLFKTMLFTITVKDVNEKPSSLCRDPIYIDLQTSDGSVIAVLQGGDPDNENAINRDPGNHTVVFKQKQQLAYSLSPLQNSWPFKIDQNNLFKNGAITQPQNFTIGVKVKDDGVIVGRFSSSGYQYITVKPLSAVLNCTIIVSEHPSKDGSIRLEPSHVSITAGNGSLVGILTTVTQNQETFSYQLEDEANVPFVIVGNKLLVSWKDIKHFRVSSSEVALIPVTVISKGSISKSSRKSFYVRIVGDSHQAENICLKPNSVKENQSPNTVVGQLIIDDSSSSISSCAKKHCCSEAGKKFDYQCKVDDSEENEINPQHRKNASSLVFLDDKFLLRTKVRLNYSDFVGSNGSLGIHISCRGITQPLHFIGRPVEVRVIDCDSNNVCPDSSECPQCLHGGSCQDVISGYHCQCISGFTGVHCETDIDDCQPENPCLNGGSCVDGIALFKCDCISGFSGDVCDRKQALCGDCPDDTLCVTFVEAAIRCLDKQYQIPILVSETSITVKRTAELEQEIASLLDQQNDNKAARKRRASSTFYVEILQKNTASSSQTLLVLTALDAGNQYSPLLASDACALLKNTDRKCVDDCDTLKSFDLPCPSNQGNQDKNLGGPDAGKSTGLGTGSISGIAVAVILVIFIILIGAIFYYRRKYKGAKREHDGVRYQAEEERVDFSNPVYGDNRSAVTSPSSPVEWEERLRKESDSFARNNLDPTSVIKRNDIKVRENVLYEAPSSDRVPLEESPNMKSVNLPEEDDIKAVKSRVNQDNEYMKLKDSPDSPEKKDCAAGGMLNPHYVMSPPMARPTDEAAGTRGTKSQKEIVSPERDLEDYLKGARVKARATDSAQSKKYKRQRSGDQGNTQEDSLPLKKNEAPAYFENPVYDNGMMSDEGRSHEDNTYATIPALQGAGSDRPRSVYEMVGPPIRPRRSSSGPSEPIQVEEDDMYEKLDFGDTEA